MSSSFKNRTFYSVSSVQSSIFKEKHFQRLLSLVFSIKKYEELEKIIVENYCVKWNCHPF